MSESEAQLQRRAGAQPLFVLSEGAERTSGRDAQSANIRAGEAVAEAVRTTLGPNGMDKMLVSDAGDVVVTNDGATILEEMDIEHPAAEMVVEVAESQTDDVGDGTTTATTLAGELLSQAEDLLEDDIHPTTIVEGYGRAQRAAVDAVDDLALDVDLDDETLRNVAATAMAGKGTAGATTDRLAEIVVDAVRAVETDGDVVREALAVRAEPGRSSTATELIDGVVGEFEPVRRVDGSELASPEIAVIDADLDRPETDADAEYRIDSPDQLTAAVQAEENQLREYAEAIVEAGADAAIVTGDVADATAGALARSDVTVFEDVDDSTASTVAAATDASIVADVDTLEPADLGSADAIRTESFDDELTVVEGGAGSDAVTVFVRGGTDHVLEELERAIRNGIDAVTAAVESGGVVPGAAATEVAVAGAVREAAAGVEGREQLAMEAYADALEAIPRTFATNAGFDPIDALVELRAANNGGCAGLVELDGDTEILDPVEHGIVDPARVKTEAYRSATEAATMIARVDDVISAA